jgi:2',3'-cyclic-nucleotide 2'-phosphodiesterase (5'-nucleotidase family)
VSFNDVYALENLPRMATLVRHWRETDPADAFIVALAGDFVAPSILSSLDSGRGMVECLAAVGVTPVVFGNHEDDVPTRELRARVRELGTVGRANAGPGGVTWLGTNVRFDPPLATSAILDVGDIRVGLVGVVMTDAAVYRRAPFGGAKLDPPNDAAMREAARLVAEGCACVVPLTHQTLDADRALARAQRSPPFPIIVGGHEHVVHVEEVAGTWIVKAGTEAEHAAIIELTWPSGGGGAPAVTVRVEDTSAYADDTALRAHVVALMRPVHELETATLVKLAPSEVLSSVGTRARQTSMGTLVCSRVRDALGAEGCVMNGGGILG